MSLERFRQSPTHPCGCTDNWRACCKYGAELQVADDVAWHAYWLAVCIPKPLNINPDQSWEENDWNEPAIRAWGERIDQAHERARTTQRCWLAHAKPMDDDARMEAMRA